MHRWEDERTAEGQGNFSFDEFGLKIGRLNAFDFHKHVSSSLQSSGVQEKLWSTFWEPKSELAIDTCWITIQTVSQQFQSEISTLNAFNNSDTQSEYWIIQISNLNIKSVSQRIQKYSQTRISNFST